jgi:putative DNA primase/helicase
LISSWPKLATCDLRIIERWSQEHEGCNWAVAAGRQSGVFVLDVDGEAGRRSLAALESQYGPLPVTLTAITGGGGEHRYFQYPVGCEVRNSVSKLGVGLDLRSTGGCAIVPPSIHPSGRVYRWIDDTMPVAAVPDWFISLLLADHHTTHQTPAQRSILVEHHRNDGLARYGGWLRRKGADLPELERKMLEANKRRCQPPLDDEDVRRIAASMARYEVAGPDPLECAWQQVAGKIYSSNEERFLALCGCLQNERPGQEIALPLQRIGDLMAVHWTSVQGYRRNAVLRGILTPTAEYVGKYPPAKPGALLCEPLKAA